VDVQEVVERIMISLSEDSEADLRASLEQVQAITSGKQKMRHLLTQVKQELRQVQQQSNHADHSDHSDDYTALVTDAQYAIEDRLDALGELSQAAAQRLQMAIDRRSKFLSTLSNIMKKMSDTDAAITQNLK
jgi:hypothetical protein